MAKTLSARAPDALAARIDQIAKNAGRSRSQVILAALEFWTQLSPEVHVAISGIQGMNEERRARLVRDVERDVLDIQFGAVRERVIAQLQVPDALAGPLAAEANDAAFLDAAVAAVAAVVT